MSDITNRYLDAVKARLDITSDYALAAKWGVTRQRISHYRSGTTSLSDERCIQVAEILGLPPEKVLFEIQSERARKLGQSGLADVLESVLRRLTATAAAIAFGLCLTTYADPTLAHAANHKNYSQVIQGLDRLHLTDNVNYAQQNAFLRWLRRLLRALCKARFASRLCNSFSYIM